MSWVKFGILAAVLGTPFGLAVYQDFVAHPRATSAGDSLEAMQDQVDDLQDQVVSARAEAAAHDRAVAAEAALISRLGEHPRLVSASAVSGIDGVSVTDGLMVDGKGKYDAGTFLELDDPDGRLHRDLSATWGAPIERTDDFDQKRAFWFDESLRVRVMLVEGGLDDRTALEVRPYTPLAPLVDQVSGYLGKPASDVPVADRDSSPLEMVLPPCEYSDAATRVQLWLAHGRVDHAVIFADLLYDREFAADLSKRLSAGRGQPTAGTTADGGDSYDFPGRPPLRMELSGEDNAMTIYLGQQEPARP